MILSFLYKIVSYTKVILINSCEGYSGPLAFLLYIFSERHTEPFKKKHHGIYNGRVCVSFLIQEKKYFHFWLWPRVEVIIMFTHLTLTGTKFLPFFYLQPIIFIF